MKRVVIWLTLLVAIGVPGVAFAQSALVDDSTIVAVDRDIVIAADETVGTLVVVSGHATVSGRASTVVVVDGSLTVDGTVEKTLVGVRTSVVLTESAVVHGDIVMPSGELDRAPGAVVDGSVARNFDLRFGWVLTLFSILFWIGITIGLMVSGLVLVAIARGQVQRSGDLLTHAAGPAILATVILVIALPVVAVVAFISVLGILVGVALLMVVLPLLWTVGYLTASERLGRTVLSSSPRSDKSQVSPYLAMVLGVLMFQIVGLIPVLGGLVVAIAATYGAGGLALYAWRSWRVSMAPTPTATPVT